MQKPDLSYCTYSVLIFHSHVWDEYWHHAYASAWT